MSAKTQLTVGKTTIEVSHLDKVLFPKTGFTKGQVIDYYVRASPVLLPHLKDRPITLKRYPEGVEGFFFYEKRCPSHRPGWVKTTAVPRREGGSIQYCLMNDLPALIWAANLADLELHTFLHRTPKIEQPTALAFDLDPGAPADIVTCCQVALWLKEWLDRLDLEGFPKTSGSKGLQVYVPLNSGATYATTKPFAHALADELARQFPETVVSNMSKSVRKGKVFVDWSQNDAHKTTVSVYSLRAREIPSVSMPVSWKEVQNAVRQKSAKHLAFDASAALKRLEKLGDLFAPVLTLKQKLPRKFPHSPVA